MNTACRSADLWRDRRERLNPGAWTPMAAAATEAPSSWSGGGPSATCGARSAGPPPGRGGRRPAEGQPGLRAADGGVRP